jgi:predicted Zn-dependent peptidase
VYRLGCFLLAAALAAYGQVAKVAEQHVTAFTLANGLRVVVLERHQSPVVALHTMVGGGSVNDPSGQTGLVSLLGRMQLKGSETVGSRDWAGEKQALDALDEARSRMEAERNKGILRNDEQYGKLRTQWRLAVDAAQRYSDSAGYRRILTDAGAADIKAASDYNAMDVSYTLPSNRLELWFSMEAQRLMHPVVRDFDQELSAVADEQNGDRAKPPARVLSSLLAAAFTAHPYRVPPAGWPSDVPELSRRRAQEFLEAHYVPGNIVMAMAGDVDPAEARRLAEKYLGPMPVRPMPPALHTVEPPQQGPRTVVLEQNGPVLLAAGYKRPDYYDKDDTALDVLSAILSNGKTGLAWQELVDDKKLVVSAQIVATYPDGQYPNLFAFLLVPAPGHSVDDALKGLDGLLGRLRTQKMPPEVVSAARNQLQSQIYQGLASNTTMARLLALHTWIFGDWKKMFTVVDDIGKITEDDVLRVTQRYFAPGNRTIVYTAIPGLPAKGSLP